jgi:hypothetical protein
MITTNGTMISDNIAIIVIGVIGFTLTLLLVLHEVRVHRDKHRKDS